MRVSPANPNVDNRQKNCCGTRTSSQFKKKQMTEVMVIAGGDLQCNKVCTFNKVSLHILKTQYHIMGEEF